MIYLDATTDKLEVITDTNGNVDCASAWVEAVSATLAVAASGKKVAGITTASTAADLSGSPSSSNTRTVKQMTAYNRDTVNIGVTVRINANGTMYVLGKWTLSPGQSLVYIDGVGFFVNNNLSQTRLLSNLESGDTQRILQSRMTEGGTFLTISGTAYYVYLGRAAQDFTAKFVEFHITTAGAGTDTKEVGLFSTPNPPCKSAQTLTKLVATGTVDVGTSTGVKRNTAAFNLLIPAGTHLWAAYRGALATTQITGLGLANDMGQGNVLTTTGGGALTSLSSASGTIPAVATATVAPALRATLD